MENKDEICIKLFYKNEKPISLNNKYKIFKENEWVEEYLRKRYSDSCSLQETLYRIKHGLENKPCCSVCGNPVNFKTYKKCFSTYCSSKCSNSDSLKKDKIKQTKYLKYGDENYNNIEKAKKTCLLKYGTSSYTQTNDFLEKVKKTNNEKYGVDWIMQNKEFVENSEITKLERYGDTHYNNREKAKTTTLKKYGVNNTKQSEQAKLKEKETCLKKYGVTSYSKTDESKLKHKETCLKKYGVTHNTKSEEWKNKWYNNKEWVENRNKNIYETMKKNNSFNTSKCEEVIYDFIKENYQDVIREYKKDERYPFKCDFYIPSLDLFIEYDGYWTHGEHDFNPKDIQDLKKLKIWQSKDNKQYKTAIKVWTNDDPLKRKYAKENNLNYIVLKYKDYKNLDLILEKINSFRK